MDSLKKYSVMMSPHAQELLDRHLAYIIEKYMNPDAAGRVADDAILTLGRLENIAGSLTFLNDPELRERGYRKINFLSHDYLMIYRIEPDHTTVRVVAVYHQMQDYENRFAREIGIR